MQEVFHKSYAQTPDGLVLIADGVNATRRWDGLASTTDTAGVIAPTTAVTVRQSGKGPILGEYSAYTRFEDSRGNLSNLSPISTTFRTYHAGDVFSATNTFPIAIGCVGHGLTTGDRVRVTNVEGTTAANGLWTVRVHDENNFSLNGAVGNGAHTALTGRWVGGLTDPPAWGVVTAATNATPIVVTSASHGLTTADIVHIRGALGNTAANGNWTITVVNANSFSLDSSVGNGAYTASSAHWISTQIGPTSGSVLSASSASPINIGSLLHGLSTGNTVTVEDVGGNTAANGTFAVTVVDSNNFTLDTSVANGTYSSGGTWKGGLGPPFHAHRITDATFATPIVITSPDHGLSDGDWVTVTSVRGNTAANGTFEVQRNGTDTFTLVDSVGNAAYVAGGIWTAGARYITYASVPVSTETKVTSRHILRNTNGQEDTFYLDVDTTDLNDTTLESPLEDDRLIDEEDVPILDTDGNALANAHTVPPDWKATLCHYNGRMFYAGEVVVQQGSCQVTNASTTVTGVGTNWTSALATRAFYVVGHTSKYTISSVNVSAQTLTLSSAYTGSTDKFAVYSIRPQPSEHRLIYYSEADLPESVPALNAISLAENDDEIVGQFKAGSYLFFVEKHHLWRFSMQTNPGTDGFAWPVATRGCVNNRCYTVVGDTVYLLDTDGIYSFTNDADPTPDSLPIQNIFRPSDSPYRINWQPSQWFHCVHYPNQETIRWFVCLSGHLPRHAIVYNYRRKYWWIEEFQRPITSSVVGELNGGRIVYLGSDAETTLAMWQGFTDGPDPDKGTTRGTLTSSSLFTATISTATFPSAGVVGNPVSIVDGRGRGQTRRVSAASSTQLTLSQPWIILPDTTSVIQVGGIPWSYQTGWFRLIEDEDNTATWIETVFEPQTEDAIMDLQVYYDFGSEPYEWTGTLLSDDNSGVRVTDGEPELTIDLTKTIGWVEHQMDRHRDIHLDGTRHLSVGLSGVSGEEPTTIFEVMIAGATQ